MSELVRIVRLTRSMVLSSLNSSAVVAAWAMACVGWVVWVTQRRLPVLVAGVAGAAAVCAVLIVCFSARRWEVRLGVYCTALLANQLVSFYGARWRLDPVNSASREEPTVGGLTLTAAHAGLALLTFAVVRQ